MKNELADYKALVEFVTSVSKTANESNKIYYGTIKFDKGSPYIILNGSNNMIPPDYINDNWKDGDKILCKIDKHRIVIL